jgi:hypothetical protein
MMTTMGGDRHAGPNPGGDDPTWDGSELSDAELERMWQDAEPVEFAPPPVDKAIDKLGANIVEHRQRIARAERRIEELEAAITALRAALEAAREPASSRAEAGDREVAERREVVVSLVARRGPVLLWHRLRRIVGRSREQAVARERRAGDLTIRVVQENRFLGYGFRILRGGAVLKSSRGESWRRPANAMAEGLAAAMEQEKPSRVTPEPSWRPEHRTAG